jgi:hypothetical protein
MVAPLAHVSQTVYTLLGHRRNDTAKLHSPTGIICCFMPAARQLLSNMLF